jgi:hypothetical protein
MTIRVAAIEVSHWHSLYDAAASSFWMRSGRRVAHGCGRTGDFRRAAHGYEPTREQAMAAFARGWR